VILAEPAAYLECRFDRAQALRVIVARLSRRLYDHGRPMSGVELTRIKLRLARAHRHLTELTGDVE
jgi:hypothetical protein